MVMRAKRMVGVNAGRRCRAGLSFSEIRIRSSNCLISI